MGTAAPMIAPHEFHATLLELGLADLAPAIVAAARPAFRLVPSEAAGALPLGTSRLGTSADLEAGRPWPRTRDGSRPLAFLAQIDCASLRPEIVPGALPGTGLLSLFYDVVEQPWGFDPVAHAGGCALLYEPSGTVLERREPPPGADDGDGSARHGETRLTAVPIVSLPRADLFVESPAEWTSDEAGFTLSPSDVARVAPLYERLIAGEGDTRHQLFGHAYPVQGHDHAFEAAMIADGRYLGDGYPEDAETRYRAAADDWRLLMQLDSDGEREWVDGGMLYVTVPKVELARGDTSGAWLFLNCY